MSEFEGKIIVLTSPSGGGKTTVVHHLMRQYPNLGFSVSVTTRAIRPDETEGVDYYYVSPERFQELIAENAFVEHEMVYPGQFYGTLKSEVERIWSQQQHVLFDIDVKGAVSIKKMYGEQSIIIFIKPPSFEILKERLMRRKSESAESIEKRLKKAELELQYEHVFDYILINDELDVTCKEAELVVERFFGCD